MNDTDQIKVETRECQECGTEVRTHVDNLHIWCTCRTYGPPLFPKGAAEWKSVGADGDSDE